MGPDSFFLFLFRWLEQFPPAGHPTHFTPFLFALIRYTAAPPIKTTRIITAITSAMVESHPFFNQNGGQSYSPLPTVCLRLFFSYDLTECKLYSEANSLSDLRILQRMINAKAMTAINPGTNAVPRDPVVISVPIWYTAKATV